MLTFFPLLTSPRPTSFRAKFGPISHLEVLPSKQDVEGSNPFSRSIFPFEICFHTLTGIIASHLSRGPDARDEDCRAREVVAEADALRTAVSFRIL